MAAVRILDHHRERRLAREVALVILSVPGLPTGRALTDEPTQVARPIAINAPAAQGEKLRAQSPATAFAPPNCRPLTGRLRSQQTLGAPQGVDRLTPDGDTEVGAHRRHVALAPGFQAIEKARLIAIVGIHHDNRVPETASVGLIQQLERNLGFGLKPYPLGDARRLASHSIPGPLAWQIEPGRDRQAKVRSA